MISLQEDETVSRTEKVGKKSQEQQLVYRNWSSSRSGQVDRLPPRDGSISVYVNVRWWYEISIKQWDVREGTEEVGLWLQSSIEPSNNHDRVDEMS
jgi:hypothetical protein